MNFKRYIAIVAFLAGISAIRAEQQPTQPLPIVLVHGILSDNYGMAPTEHYIRKHIGEHVYIKNVQLGFGEITSFTNLKHQLEHLRETLQTDPKLTHGFNMVTHSQGGLVGRYYIERYNNPRVINYISLGSPQQGVFGLPGTFDNRFKWLDYMEGYAHHVLYSKGFQKFVSFAGYWHDTLHYNKYIKKCRFLPYLNNQIDHPDSALFKKNICSLKNMVLVMSSNDDIIEPRISCHFGFYKMGSKTEIEEMIATEIYKKDTLGLRTLNESGRLHLRMAECTHAEFQEDEQNFIANVVEFLKDVPPPAPSNPIPPAHPSLSNNAPIENRPKEQATT